MMPSKIINVESAGSLLRKDLVPGTGGMNTLTGSALAALRSVDCAALEIRTSLEEVFTLWVVAAREPCRLTSRHYTRSFPPCGNSTPVLLSPPPVVLAGKGRSGD